MKVKSIILAGSLLFPLVGVNAGELQKPELLESLNTEAIAVMSTQESELARGEYAYSANVVVARGKAINKCNYANADTCYVANVRRAGNGYIAQARGQRNGRWVSYSY